ncbi:MAG: outer membrane protein assembly factor [Rhodanobacteraceae bacterium]|nr:outer membrane protein assembly factor [Rhodanobacteraceae bacterium]MBK7043789.1 outer membrane protein assembly factor [Rhodanobacteraceae bacterium]MBP9155589.1 outer membrane protein assembly factor [Xanthomonadales bacterium]HQW80471.1 autotransporter assembly complex family protein [Pseudomonadota bacterium]
MRWRFIFLVVLIIGLLAAVSTVAARPGSAIAPGVVALEINGLDEEQTAAVLPALEVASYRNRSSIGERRLQRLLRQIEGEVDGALEVFGYYAATTQVRLDPLADGRYRVHLDVALGEPVRVRAIDVTISGAAMRNERIGGLISDFAPAIGEAFDHRVYEASKAAIERALLRRGYLTQRLVERRVEIDRAAASARIVLRYESGTRHFLGKVQFLGAQFDDRLMQRFVPWPDGYRFDQARVEALQQTLAASNYFDHIEISQGDIDPATLRVPLTVQLSPNSRTRYVAGVSYGSDEGAGVRGGIERRWVNARGHQFFGEAELAQRRSALYAEYALPQFAAKISRYTIATRWQDEQTDNIDARSFLLSGNAVARGDHWYAQASLNVLDGSFLVGARSPGQARQSARVVYPEFHYERVFAEDRVHPHRGASLDLRVLAASDSVLSDIALLQGRATVKGIMPAGLGARLIAQITLGATATEDFARLPPELRFFAGGDRSVRGYGYQDLGARDEQGLAIGGRYLATTSMEYEREFMPGWSAAGFIDAGDVWSRGKPRFEFALGTGVRWQSPVGPIRIDIAHGFDEISGGWQLHLSAGPDL